MCQIWDGNPLTSYAVVFLQSAGFNELQAFNMNMGINACFVAGPLICYLLFPILGRRTIYMSGLGGMLLTLVTVRLWFRRSLNNTDTCRSEASGLTAAMMRNSQSASYWLFVPLSTRSVWDRRAILSSRKRRPDDSDTRRSLWEDSCITSRALFRTHSRQECCPNLVSILIHDLVSH